MNTKVAKLIDQKDFDIELPAMSDLHEVGTVASILKIELHQLIRMRCSF